MHHTQSASIQLQCTSPLQLTVCDFQVLLSTSSPRYVLVHSLCSHCRRIAIAHTLRTPSALCLLALSHQQSVLLTRHLHPPLSTWSSDTRIAPPTPIGPPIACHQSASLLLIYTPMKDRHLHAALGQSMPHHWLLHQSLAECLSLEAVLESSSKRHSSLSIRQLVHASPAITV